MAQNESSLQTMGGLFNGENAVERMVIVQDEVPDNRESRDDESPDSSMPKDRPIFESPDPQDDKEPQVETDVTSSPHEMIARLSQGGLSNAYLDQLFDEAVREQLAEPAKKVADRIANSASMKLSPISLGFGGELFDEAVREQLAEPAKKVADEISASSMSWVRHVSNQPLEPWLYSELLSSSEGTAKSIAGEEPLVSTDCVSSDLAYPGSMFEKHQIEVKSFQGLVQKMDWIRRKMSGFSVTWRGQSNARWGLQSTLYRQVLSAKGVIMPGEDGYIQDLSQVYPSDDDLVVAERLLIDMAGKQWRMSDRPSIELLARMQHRGIPTRLLDVTRNPLLALWFAVCENPDEDARVFAIVHRPVAPTRSKIERKVAEQLWSSSSPFWFELDSDEKRISGIWGMGSRIREIKPPDYDRRISAQNALFLLDGVPAVTNSVLESFNTITRGSWTAADISASMSVVLAPVDPSDELDDENPLSRVVSLHIPAKLKPRIMDTLQNTYGLDWGTVYPDIDGMKAQLAMDPKWLQNELGSPEH